MAITNPTNVEQLRQACRENRGNLGVIDVSRMRDFSDLFNIPEFQAWNNNDFNGINRWDLSGKNHSGYDNGTYENMFKGCVNLNSITLSIEPKYRYYTYYRSMFEGCTGLSSVNITINDNTGYSAYFENMFKGCINLSSVTFNLTTKDDTYLNSMFEDCRKLSSVNGSINISGATLDIYTEKMFKNTNISSIAGLFNIKSTNYFFIAPYMFENCTRITEDIFFKEIKITGDAITLNLQGLYKGCTGLRSFDPVKEVEYRTGIKEMFYGCSNLTTVYFRIKQYSNINGDMSGLFYGCSKLTNINWSNYEQVRVFALESSYMFYGCSSLNQDLSNIDFSSSNDCSYMFYGCSKITTINTQQSVICKKYDHMFDGASVFDQDLSSWVLSPSSTYVDMFNNCRIQNQHKPAPLNGKQLFKPETREQLKEYCDVTENDLGLVDTSLITDMSYLFENSQRDEESMFRIMFWDMSKVTTIRGMFKNTNLEFINYNSMNGYYLNMLDLSSVEDASECFMGNTRIQYVLDPMKRFIFPQVINSRANPLPPEPQKPVIVGGMDKLKYTTSMYEGCSRVNTTSLSFDTSNIINMDRMFKGTAFTGELFNNYNYNNYKAYFYSEKLKSMVECFADCSNWTSYDGRYFDASTNPDMTDAFKNTPVEPKPWWYILKVPEDFVLFAEEEKEIDLNEWMGGNYTGYTFNLENKQRNISIQRTTGNKFKLLSNELGEHTLTVSYQTYGKRDITINVVTLSADRTKDIKAAVINKMDLTEEFLFDVNTIEFSNMQEGLSITPTGQFTFDVITDNVGTYTADITINGNINGVFTFNATKLIEDFQLNLTNSIVVNKNFNEEYPDYNLEEMEITSNSDEVIVNRTEVGVYMFKSLNVGNYTATIRMREVSTEITIISTSPLKDLEYTYKATERKNLILEDLFGREINYNEFSITSNDENFVCDKLNLYKYDLIGLVSGTFTANIQLNNEIKTITYTSTKLIQDTVKTISANKYYDFDLKELLPNSVINSFEITCDNPNFILTNVGSKYKLIANDVGMLNCTISINGEDTSLILTVEKLIQDQIIYVNNEKYKLNLNTMYPGIDNTNIVVRPVNNTSFINIDNNNNGIINFNFLKRGSYEVSITLGNVVSTFTFKVFFVNLNDPEIYQYPDVFIDKLIKPQLFDSNLYIYQYNQYGQIEWISRFFDYINNKMKKYYKYIYLWFVLKTNQDLSKFEITQVDDNESYFYLNFLERYYDEIYKAFGVSSSTVFWDGDYKWNQEGILWDTKLEASNLTINKFKSFLRFIRDINNKTYNIFRFIQFCNEFVNADVDEADKVTIFVDETSFEDPSTIIIYTTKRNVNTNILDSIIRSTYKNMMPINDFVIREKKL